MGTSLSLVVCTTYYHGDSHFGDLGWWNVLAVCGRIANIVHLAVRRI